MPHVSKKKLSKEDSKKLYGSFLRSLGKLRGQPALDKFLWEFLSPTEKEMFSKRLAIIVLLDKGISHYAIWNALNVSPSTVERIAKKLDRGGFVEILNLLKEDNGKLLKILETLFEVLAPPPYHVSRKRFIEAKRRGE